MADVVSTGEAFSSTDALREFWPVTVEVAVGTALIDVADRPGVAYTPSGGHVITKTVGPVTISGFPDGGASLDPLEVSVSTDGTYEFPVTGASASTPKSTKVYAVVAAGRITELTLTVGTNKFFGIVNNPHDYVASASAICVKIGV